MVGDEQLAWSRLWRKFTRLTRAGVTVLRALSIIEEEEPDGPRRRAVASLRERVESGATLAEATETMPDIFSRSVRELLRTAEARGAWDVVLPEIADGLAEGTFD